MTTRELYRQVFAWVELQKMYRPKPGHVIGFGKFAHYDFNHNWDLGVLSLVAHWGNIKLPEEVAETEIQKAIALAKTYDPINILEIGEILERVKAQMIANNQK